MSNRLRLIGNDYLQCVKEAEDLEHINVLIVEGDKTRTPGVQEYKDYYLDEQKVFCNDFRQTDTKSALDARDKLLDMSYKAYQRLAEECPAPPQ